MLFSHLHSSFVSRWRGKCLNELRYVVGHRVHSDALCLEKEKWSLINIYVSARSEPWHHFLSNVGGQCGGTSLAVVWCVVLLLSFWYLGHMRWTRAVLPQQPDTTFFFSHLSDGCCHYHKALSFCHNGFWVIRPPPSLSVLLVIVSLVFFSAFKDRWVVKHIVCHLLSLHVHLLSSLFLHFVVRVHWKLLMLEMLESKEVK